MGRLNPTGRALRPIVRESYDSDRYPVAELAVHEYMGIREVGQVPSGPRISDPVLSGAKIASPGRVKGASFNPQNNKKFN